jgi:site-specific DNA recombinase
MDLSYGRESAHSFRRAIRAGTSADASAAGKKQPHTGGKPKYLLSGLLRCSVCGACYVGANQREYGCSSHKDGGACSNGVRVRRDAVENILLGPVRKELLAPERVERMGKEMRTYFLDRACAMETRAIEAPRELQELRARIDRLSD